MHPSIPTRTWVSLVDTCVSGASSCFWWIHVSLVIPMSLLVLGVLEDPMFLVDPNVPGKSQCA